MTSLWNAVRPPGPVAGYGLSLIALAAVLALRWALDPLLGDTMPIVTLYGAVAAAIWLSGLTAAVTVTIVGYVIADYFFIEPRGALGLTDPTNLVGFLAYLLTCTFIIAFGSLLRIARAREADAREVLQVTLHSIGDAVITTDLAGTVTYLNDVAKSLTGWDNETFLNKSRYPDLGSVISRMRSGVEDAEIRSFAASSVGDPGLQRAWKASGVREARTRPAMDGWAILDSNQGPLPYQRSALTD